jgi:hypothetical protein
MTPSAVSQRSRNVPRAKGVFDSKLGEFEGVRQTEVRRSTTVTGFECSVDRADWTAGDDLAVDLASAALEMSLSAGRAEQAGRP